MKTVAKNPGLQRRGLAYYVRVRIPQDLLPAYKPMTEKVKSLQTRDYDVACNRIHHVRAKISAEFKEKRLHIKKVANNPDMLSNHDDHELGELTLRWLADVEKRVKAGPAKRAAWLKKEGIEDVPQDNAEILATLEDDVRQTHEEFIGLSDDEIHYGMDAAAKYLKERGITFNAKSEVFRQLGELFSSATYDMAQRALLLRQGKPFTPTTAIFARHHMHMGGGMMQGTTGVPQSKRRTLQQVMDEFMDNPETHRSSSTRKNYTIIDRALKEMLGADKFVHEITREDTKAVRALLMRLPANATKHAPGKTLKEACELAVQNDWPPLSPATINMYLDKMNAMLNFASREGYIQKNEAKGINVKDNVQKKDKRKPLSADQLKAIFTAPLYTGCKDGERGYNTVGAARPRNARFWIPVIALFTGMRLNEICQLHVADIAVQEGVDVILITTEDMAEGGDDEEKRVKTDAGVRFVPVHPELRRIGFMDFVAEAKKAGQKRLFPDLKKDKDGYFSGRFSKWFSDFLTNTKVKTRRTTFHSFRHSFRDALRRAEISTDAGQQLGGWANDRVDQDYGEGLPADDLLKSLEKMGYKGLDLSHLYMKKTVTPP